MLAAISRPDIALSNWREEPSGKLIFGMSRLVVVN
jgi:hypothetical protein